MIESFSFSPEDLEVIQRVKKIAKEDGINFSQVIIQLLKECDHKRSSEAAVTARPRFSIFSYTIGNGGGTVQQTESDDDNQLTEEENDDNQLTEEERHKLISENYDLVLEKMCPVIANMDVNTFAKWKRSNDKTIYATRKPDYKKKKFTPAVEKRTPPTEESTTTTEKQFNQPMNIT